VNPAGIGGSYSRWCSGRRLTVTEDDWGDVVIWGAVLGLDSVVLGANAVGPSITARYSKCHIARALDTIAVVEPLGALGGSERFDMA
jgi:hypothetical protein